MPVIQTFVSTPLDHHKRLLLAIIYRIVTRVVLGKPEDLVMMTFHDSTPMHFFGSTDPVACVRVEALGGYGPSEPEKVTSIVTAAITAVCGIVADRIFVLYFSPLHCGWNGTNFLEHHHHHH
uniref:Macrophage migration inhibitory factor-like protein n=1 Tax=Leishmania major TaxID=5664 RepID=UPI00045FEC3A|nr:Chain 1, Macrophage migration inhibitory factor-like protein [Leishmania major]4NWR_3 Chain 3, Macrophage migration inhibitory factor-like protein [Leishmania major]4NWR_5 Chain 5, Macrophage migration inhibitory factor-like protein [Leishmania major]4NWR_7 Chain 7, Macrophage migration inhibitory factor-like protein [Leishmania major]4NWR_9 Chain 9, Macrophage migration inhibitory factor-like protein [Leishmania major]4NWR_AB Chain AB, Macrophage migration inhibitory factor-like protein [L